jgi:hypothetical protein
MRDRVAIQTQRGALSAKQLRLGFFKSPVP